MATALPYQWVRISWKLNGSVDNNLGTRRVSSTDPTGTTPVCWDGAEEILLSGTTDCTKMAGLTPPGPAATPVYLVTSLAVGPTSGARRMVQGGVASHPFTTYLFGLYANRYACWGFTIQRCRHTVG